MNEGSGSSPTVSIIIPHQAGNEILCQCLKSVLAYSGEIDSEVIVVDNGGTDGSIQAATEQFPSIQVIRLPENRGFAVGCNEGIKKARGKYVILLNDDTEVCEGSEDVHLNIVAIATTKPTSIAKNSRGLSLNIMSTSRARATKKMANVE